jgi:hypothetical protein
MMSEKGLLPKKCGIARPKVNKSVRRSWERSRSGHHVAQSPADATCSASAAIFRRRRAETPIATPRTESRQNGASSPPTYYSVQFSGEYHIGEV